VGDATLIEVVQAAAEMIGHNVSEPFKSMHSWDRDNSPERPTPVRSVAEVLNG
jgi:hypothetical protein